jgi:hypothetical protein
MGFGLDDPGEKPVLPFIDNVTLGKIFSCSKSWLPY